MSEVITKQTITGGELPQGALVSYVRDIYTNLIYVYTYVAATGVISRQALPVFPPTSFTSSPTAYLTVNAGFSGSFDYYYGDRMLAKDSSGLWWMRKDAASSFVIAPSQTYSFTPSAVAGSGRSVVAGTTFEGGVLTGLGLTVGGEPNLTVWLQSWNSALGTDQLKGFAISALYCQFSGNTVLSYGSYYNGYYGYILLNNANGTMVQIQNNSTAITYTALAMPVDSTIVLFKNGYYICETTGGALSLYSINNGGTFMADLDLGSSAYNVDLDTEMFLIF